MLSGRIRSDGRERMISRLRDGLGDVGYAGNNSALVENISASADHRKDMVC